MPCFYFYVIYCCIVKILGFHILLCIVGMMGRTVGFVCAKLWVRISASSNVCH